MEHSEILTLLNDHIKNIKKRRITHYKKWKRLKKLNNASKITIKLLNGVTVSNIVISLSTFPPLIIASLISSSLSMLGGLALDTYSMEDKITSHHTSYCNFDSLLNDINSKLLKHDINYETLLNTVISSIALINDMSEPVSFSDSF